MTITLDLTPDTEARLRQKADTEGLDFKEYLQHSLATLPQMAVQDYGVLFSRPPTEQEKAELVAALDSFDEFDEAEQQETGESLLRALKGSSLTLRRWSS